MTIQDYYNLARDYKAKHVLWLLKYLIQEKQLISFADDVSVLDYYLQPQFKDSFNTRLLKYIQEQDKLFQK
jgi:uncharacterized protein YpiB (UPF0302 family)